MLQDNLGITLKCTVSKKNKK